MSHVVVFDVGGTKVAATIIDETGRDLLNGTPHIIETPERAPAEQFVQMLIDELLLLEKQFGDVVAWGAAFPGPYKRLPNGELLAFPRNVPGMRGRSLEADMGSALPGLPGIVDNDLKLATWGEFLIGSLRGARNGIGVVHGTGVSSALIVNGAMLRGPDNNAGEIGCLLVERDPTKARPCDSQDGAEFGHLESQIRGPALAEVFFNVDRNNKHAVHTALANASIADHNAMIEYCSAYLTNALAPILQAASIEQVMMFGGIATLLGESYALALTQKLRESSEVFRAANSSVQLARYPRFSPLVAAAQQAFAKVDVAMELHAPMTW